MFVEEDENPDWEMLEFEEAGFEFWQDDEVDDLHDIGCEYCGEPDTRIDPFGGKPCCEDCFILLISGED